LDFQGGNRRLLNTQEARKEFCSRYKDQLYDLAFTITHDQKQACNLVVSAFQHAFQKYASTPCPDDSYPFLSSAVYLLYATGDEAEDHCSGVTNPDMHAASCSADAPARGGETPPRDYDGASAPDKRRQPVPEYVSIQEEDPADPGSDKVTFTEAAGRPPVSAEPAPEEEPTPAEPVQDDAQPRHAQTQQTDFSQPLSRQVFDPEHTDYWTPGMDQPEESASTAAGARRAQKPGDPVVRQAAQSEDPFPDPSPQQPNISQAYMYDAKIAKKRKSPALRIINTLLFLLFVWMSIGLLICMDVLPQWNLGYAWFNLYIFPLF